MAVLADETLTGLWLCDDNAIYYVRHRLGRVWWTGLSADSPLGVNEFHPGVRFANVFCGRLVGDIVIGEWADTPRGDMPQNGLMDLVVASDSEMRVEHQVGGFGGTAWRRVDPPKRIDITAGFAEFDDTNPKRSRTYAETAVVHGMVVTEPSLLDGDIVMSVRLDPTLCRLSEVPARLVNRPLRCRIPGLTGSTFLPGWKQRDGDSVLFSNGHPINGDVAAAPETYRL